MNTEAVTVDKENGVQRVKFNVQNFQPEEIDLNVVDNILRVHAVHKSTADGSNVHREYRLATNYQRRLRTLRQQSRVFFYGRRGERSYLHLRLIT